MYPASIACFVYDNDEGKFIGFNKTANDVARYYVLKWLSEQNEIPLQQAVHIAWYICREVTMRLFMLLYYRKQLSDPAYDFAKTLRSFKTFLYNDFMKMYK